MRELRERLAYAPTDLRRKVYILDEAHQITKDAWNALLKSLEEPPEFVTFMFASTHPQEFPPAILSRLQRFDVRRLTVPEITGKLERILAADGREADPEAVALVARLAAGGMRDAESILDQLLASTGGRVEAESVRELLGLADAESVDGFVAALATGDAVAGIALLDALEDRGRDLRVFLDQVVDAIRERLLASLTTGGDDAPLIASARRLGSIDPTRLGPGGLRLQLELALLDPTPAPGPHRSARPTRRPACGADAADRCRARRTAARPRTGPPTDAGHGHRFVGPGAHRSAAHRRNARRAGAAFPGAGRAGARRTGAGCAAVHDPPAPRPRPPIPTPPPTSSSAFATAGRRSWPAPARPSSR